MPAPILGNLINVQTSVGTSPALITSPSSPRAAIAVTNLGAGTIYIGGTSSVTTTTGYPIAAGGTFTMEYSGAIFAIAVSGTQDVRTIQGS